MFFVIRKNLFDFLLTYSSNTYYIWINHILFNFVIRQAEANPHMWKEFRELDQLSFVRL